MKYPVLYIRKLRSLKDTFRDIQKFFLTFFSPFSSFASTYKKHLFVLQASEIETLNILIPNKPHIKAKFKKK